MTLQILFWSCVMISDTAIQDLMETRLFRRLILTLCARKERDLLIFLLVDQSALLLVPPDRPPLLPLWCNSCQPRAFTRGGNIIGWRVQRVWLPYGALRKMASETVPICVSKEKKEVPSYKLNLYNTNYSYI